MLVQVCVAQRQRLDPLPHQFLHRVLAARRVARVAKTGRPLGAAPRALLHLAQQQAARLTGDGPAVKPAHHPALIQGMKWEGFLVALCKHQAVPSSRQKPFPQNH